MVLAVFATVSVKAQLDEDVQTPDVGEEDTLSLEFGNPTIFAGPSILFYNGDLNKSGKKVGFNASFNYGCDIGFEQRFTKFWGVSAEIGFNRIFHSFDSKPFYSFKTDLYRFQVKNIFLFEDRIAFARVDDFSTFVFVGGGFSKYDTRG
ncbi:MAG: hypothetical protein KKA07_12185, partial [Bacteroidetes bacterium]|nr:hypothetical protein [Bacteroidota bacterium]